MIIDHKSIKIAADTGRVVDGGFAILFQIDEFSTDRKLVRGTFLIPNKEDSYDKLEDVTWFPIETFSKGFDYVCFNTGTKRVKATSIDVNPWITSRIQ